MTENQKPKSFGSIAAEGKQTSTTGLVSTGVSGSFPGVSQSQLENSAFYHARQSPPPSDHVASMGSDRKRGRRSLVNDENTLDDILGQLTSKINNLLTTEDEKREELVNAFIDVLGCSRSESSFYLESTEWKLEPAVILWLENNQQGVARYSYNDYQPPRPSTVDLSDLSGAYHSGVNSGINKKYRPRTVDIEGLPVDWMAIVNANNGVIQFRHIPTGFVQSNVPPGFADLTGDPLIDDIEVDSWGLPKMVPSGGESSSSSLSLSHHASSSQHTTSNGLGGHSRSDAMERDFAQDLLQDDVDENASNACVDGNDDDDEEQEDLTRNHVGLVHLKSTTGVKRSGSGENYPYAANRTHHSEYANSLGNGGGVAMMESRYPDSGEVADGTDDIEDL